MATLAMDLPPQSPTKFQKRRSCARKCERGCCQTVAYIPLVFVYGLTTWAVYVQASLGFDPIEGSWTGLASAVVGIVLYVLLNGSYSVAVFTSPGSPLDTMDTYARLPESEGSSLGQTSFTVKSTGELRYCKKCNCRKPDRAHHCSTCRRCVLKMDHHCPWLATCVGLKNYKPFLLFLIYTVILCWVCFAATASWVWNELFDQSDFNDRLLPVNYILLSVISGIIGLVLAGFTAWHIYLACRGQTTIESLETTRYLTSIKKSMRHQLQAQDRSGNEHTLGEQLREMHANALPGVLRPEEGEEHTVRSSPARDSLRRNFADSERRREQERYEEYLDECDSEKLPNAFDHGWRANLQHIFGPNKLFWFLPVCNTSGDGWRWEPSQKWLNARELVAREREARKRENRAFDSDEGWRSRGSPIDFRADGLIARAANSVSPSGPPHNYAGSVQNSSPGSVVRHPVSRGQDDSTDGYDDDDDEEAEDSTTERTPFTQTKRRTGQMDMDNWNDIPEDYLASRKSSGLMPQGTSRTPTPRAGKRTASRNHSRPDAFG